MTRRKPLSEEERRSRLFRRMTLIYGWGPPLLLVLTVVAGGALVALLLPLALPFLYRWAIASALALGIPLAVYLVVRYLRG